MDTTVYDQCGATVTGPDQLVGRDQVPAERMQRPPRHRRALVIVAKGALAATLIALCVSRFATVDGAELWSLLAEAGWAIGLILIPPLCALAIDTTGLALCLPMRCSRHLFMKVLPVRIGCDTLGNIVPGGMAVAEPLRPLALALSLNSRIEQCAAACLIGKVNMAASQALFLSVIALFLFTGGESSQVVRRFPFGVEAGVLSAVGIAGLFGLLVFVYTGPRCTQISGMLAHIPIPRWRFFLARRADSLRTVDLHVRAFARKSPGCLVGSIGLFVAGWICAGLESFVILAVLDVEVSLAEGLLLEGIASLLRILFFVLPSALGVAEVSYLSLIAAFGIADPVTVAAAFIALKRGRELLWATGGVSCLMFMGLLRHGRRRTS